MSNLVFVVWMIFWPLGCSVSRYLYFLRGDGKDDGAALIASLIELGIWIWVSTLLYEKP